MLRYFFIAILIFSASASHSQKLLFHKNTYKEQAYQAGDVISFRLVGDRTKITRQILRFEDSLMVFNDYKINPKNISAIYVDKKTRTWFVLRYKYKFLFPVIGGGYALLELVNTGEVERKVLIFSGSLITAGILARLFIPNWIKIKGKKKLVIVK